MALSFVEDHQFYFLSVPTEQLPDYLIEGAHYIQSQIPEEALAGDGLETNYHITINYGIQDRDSYFLIRDNIVKSKGWSSIDCFVGLVNSFRGNDDSDVLKIEIISPKLTQIHYEVVNQIRIQDSHSLYCAHITLAYIKKGYCQDLEGPFPLTGHTFSIDCLQWQHITDYKLPIPLS